MTTSIHFLLVSAQAAPNLLPVLDPLLKPVKAVLVVTQKMHGRADVLQAVLIEAGARWNASRWLTNTTSRVCKMR